MGTATKTTLPVTSQQSQETSALAYLIAALIFAMGWAGLVWGIWQMNLSVIITSSVIIVFCFASFKVAAQWQKAIVLRLGRLHKVTGPGPFLILPIIDNVVAWIDQRIIATSFHAEETLTKDTVPVDVDAVMFWMVWDPEKAALEVADYEEAVSWAAQTALREVIGRTLLSDILASRGNIDEELREIIDGRTEPWGIAVQTVEIRDVIIPGNLQDAMSREAQAERERRARIILGTAETEIAAKFAEASKWYEGNEIALQLRALNLLYEGLREKGSLVVVPSSALHTMNLGAVTGLASLTKQFSDEQNESTG